MVTVDIDGNMLWRFRFNACDNQSDGFDRALWYDKKEKEFFETCESKSTDYTFDNPNDIVLLIFVSGDNNSMGLDEVCDGCSGICDCEKGDILYEICCPQKFEEWYPIEAVNWGTNEVEDIEFIEV